MYAVKVTEASESGLQDAVETVRKGGIVAHATETCYGLASNLTNHVAVEKLFLLKQRPNTLPVSALFPSVEEAARWVEWNDAARELAKKHLPGPLTLVLAERQSLPTHRDGDGNYHIISYGSALAIPHGSRTIGVRVSSHPVARRLAELCACPLGTTSANLHGHPEPYGVAEITKQFSGQDLQPDLILDSGMLPHAPPSTIVDITNGTIRIIRQGAVVISSAKLPTPHP